jgi:hypothetical protein
MSGLITVGKKTLDILEVNILVYVAAYYISYSCEPTVLCPTVFEQAL